ncbi:MAG: bifunctional helix-turn-helix transcriptional regulator/GNAT family N-acetyltransferase [Candidatus Cloacimonetes bacterium]|nr:bifunctional helix-turn-helix transcriptional regulator/GNAT family N-acetyltransferase [Candidatus Cloacimonadota bacterium]
MDYISSLGILALGHRLKIISDNILEDTSQFYKDSKIKFRSNWFPLFTLLLKEESISVGKAAILLNQSHVFISQTSKQMIQSGLLKKVKSKKDSRISNLKLSEEGLEVARQLTPVWQDIHSGLLDISGFSGIDLEQVISQLEITLKDNDLLSQIQISKERRISEEIEVFEYNRSYHSDFYKISHLWMSKLFGVSPQEQKLLENPKKYVLDLGGKILLARYKNEIVASSSIVRLSYNRYQLTKIGVLEDFRGLKIGKKLLAKTIEKCKHLGAKSIYLQTSQKCPVATSMFRNFGFTTIKQTLSDDQDYEISLELDIK